MNVQQFFKTTSKTEKTNTVLFLKMAKNRILKHTQTHAKKKKGKKRGRTNKKYYVMKIFRI